MNKSLKLIWLLLCISSLILTLYLFKFCGSDDSEIILIYSMIFLTFPIGFIAAMILTGLIFISEHNFGIIVVTSAFFIVTEWIFFLLFGYLQWFVLIPKVISVTKKRKK